MSMNRAVTHLQILLLGLASVSATPALAREAVIAKTGDNIPVGNGTYTTFGIPVLNDAGQAAFAANLTGTDDSFNDNLGLFRYDGPLTQQIAREGQLAPDNNGNLSSFGDISINAPGQVTFRDNFIQNTLLGSGLISDDAGIFQGTGGPLTQLARTGQLSPDMTETFAGDFGNYFVTDAGDVLYDIGHKTGPGSIGTNAGLYKNQGGTTKIAVRFDSVPGGDGEYSSLFPYYLHDNGDADFHSSILNNSGGADDNTALYRGSGGPVTELVREGDTAPDGVSEYGGMFGTVFNAPGNFVFRSLLRNSPLGDDDNNALFRNNDGVITQVVREPDPAPDGNGKFEFILDPDFNNAGGIAFAAQLKDTSLGTIDNEGVFLVPAGGPLTQLARRGDPAPDGDGTLADIDQSVLINDHGVVLFKATVGNTADATDDEAYYLADARDVVLIARVGQPLLGSTVTNVDILNYIEADAQNSFNNQAQVAYKADIANGTDALVLFTPDLRWRETFSGFWDTPDHWTLGLTPGPIYNVSIDPITSLSVASPTTNTTVRSLTLGGGLGHATLALSGITFTTEEPLTLAHNGDLHVNAGATLSTPDANLGTTSGPAAHMTIAGAGTSFDVENTLVVGDAGIAELTVQSSATAIATDVTLGNDASSSGSLTVELNASLTADTLTVGQAGHGDATIQSGGAADVTGATEVAATSTASGHLTIQGPGSTFTTNDIKLGRSGGTGSLTIADGGQATSFPGNSYIGYSGGTGHATVTGPGSLWTTGTLDVGFSTNGAGTLLIDDGATVNSTSTFIGLGSGAVGTATADGHGTNWLVSSSLYLGLSNGTGTLNITDHAVVGKTTTSVTVEPGSVINIDGGTLIANSFAGTGQINLIEGTLHANGFSDLTISDDLFDPNLELGPDTTILAKNDATIDASIDLTLTGGTVSADNLIIQGNAAVQSGTLAANTAVTNHGDIQLDNAITARIDTPLLNNNADLSGSGRVTGNLNNNTSGRISLTGGTLRIDGTLTNAANALILGAGTLRADTAITNLANATMAFSGQTNILGDVDNQADALIISSGGGPVTFYDDVINNGEIRTSDNSFTVFFGDYSGAGTLTTGPQMTGTVIMEGDVNPGNSPAAVNFGGDLAFGPAATYHAEIGGLLPGTEHDQINVSGNATLAGTLDIEIIDTFDLDIVPFDAFTIMTWGDNPGDTEFGTVNFTPPVTIPGISFDINYNEFDLSIEATALGGDANLDGTVDLTDLTILAINFETPFETRRWRKADFNNDGLTNLTDLTILAINFGSMVNAGAVLPGPGADITTLAAAVGLNLNQVPEPASLTIFVLSTLALRRRHASIA